ncbi:MAG TPA: hypothetical protein VIC06_02740 [Solirubrobacteraceae bacterium]
MPTGIPGPPKGIASLPLRVLARIFNRTATHCALALAALVVGLEPLLVRSLGASAPGWSHWWCSAASISGAHHATGSGALGGALHTTLALLAVHWPHFLPILLALGTLVYLWRANEAWRAEAPGPGSARTSRTLSG